MLLEREFLTKEIRKAEKLSQRLNGQHAELINLMEQKLIERSERKPTLLCPLPTRSDVLSVAGQNFSTGNFSTKK